LQELQANICSVLTVIKSYNVVYAVKFNSLSQNIIRRLGSAIKPIADNTMMTLLTILNSSSRTSIVHEDAFIVVSALSSGMFDLSF
jgi:hypothetical protein